jgi:hypothetical protein
MEHPKRPSPLVTALKVAIVLGLLAVVLWTNQEEIRQVLSRPIRWDRFGLGFLFLLSGITLAAVRWYLLVAALGLPFPVLDALRLAFIGIFFCEVLPGAVGGDVVRAACLCQAHPTRRGLAIASIVVDRFLGLAGLFAIAVLAGAVGWARLDPPVRRLVLFASVTQVVVLGVLTIAFSPALYRPLARRVAGRRRLSRALSELTVMGTVYRSRLPVVALGLGLAMVTHWLNVLSFYEVNQALFPTTPSLAEHFLVVPLVLFSTAIPLPFGALGASEQISGELFKLAASSSGAVAMMGFRVLLYGAAILGLGAYLARLRQVRELIRLETDLGDNLPSPVPTATRT